MDLWQQLNLSQKERPVKLWKLWWKGKWKRKCLPKTFQKSHMHTHMHLHCLEMIWQLTRELGGFQYIFVNFLESVKCIIQC